MGKIADTWTDIKKVSNDPLIRAIAAFIAGKNAGELGAWLQKLGKAMASGKQGAVAKMAISAGVKLAGLGAAAYIAYKEVVRMNKECKIIVEKDIPGIQKIARVALETWPPTMAIRSIDAAWKWLTKKPSQVEDSGKQLAPISNPSNLETGIQVKPVKQSIVTPEEAGKQVVEYERSKANKLPTYKTTSDKFAEYMKRNSKGNHPEWYSKMKEFITTNLNFGVRKEAQYFDVAGGAAISAVQTLPLRNKTVSQSYVDQMHVLFAKLRGSNSGAFNYTVSDVMAYIECVRGIRIVMHTLARNLKSIMNVDLYVAKTPEMFMNILGIDAAGKADLEQNRAIYISRYNQYAELIDANFPTPPEMTVFKRDEYLAATVLEEGKGPKSSIFAYQFKAVIKADSNPGKIDYANINDGNIITLFSVLDTLLAAAHAYVSATYTNPDTFAKISGDIFKAYGQKGLALTLPRVTLNDRVQTIFDEYLLHQLQNAQVLTLSWSSLFYLAAPVAPESFTATAKIRVRGASGRVIPLEKLPGNAHAGSEPLIINTNKSNISGEEAISLTRGNWYYDLATNLGYSNSPTDVEVDTCDTVALTYCYMYNFKPDGTIGGYTLESTGSSVVDMDWTSMWTQLDYAPAFWKYYDADDNGYRHLYEDIDTYAYMTLDQYRAFTDVAILSMYKTVDISDQVNFRAVKR